LKPSSGATRKVLTQGNSDLVHPVETVPLEAYEEASGRSLRRGLRVLDAVLQGGGDGVRVIDLCRQCELPRAPVYRVLTTLMDCGYVVQRGRFRYAPGPSLAMFAVRKDETDLAVSLQPVLDRISAACGDASFAVLREGSLSRCIARQIGNYPVQILSVQVGTRQPLGVGAAGLALLAGLPHGEACTVISANSAALSNFGGMTESRLDLLVKATRERGWSVVGNHAAKGAMGVGLSVHSRGGQPIAGVSVAAAMDRMPKERQRLIASLIREAVKVLLPNGL
jgi:DNA-binding IclR family transcriptional regulator